jgi:hypothetical protein
MSQPLSKELQLQYTFTLDAFSSEIDRTASSVLVTTALGVSAGVALANTPTVGSLESTIPAEYHSNDWNCNRHWSSIGGTADVPEAIIQYCYYTYSLK